MGFTNAEKREIAVGPDIGEIFPSTLLYSRDLKGTWREYPTYSFLFTANKVNAGEGGLQQARNKGSSTRVNLSSFPSKLSTNELMCMYIVYTHRRIIDVCVQTCVYIPTFWKLLGKKFHVKVINLIHDKTYVMAVAIFRNDKVTFSFRQYA